MLPVKEILEKKPLIPKPPVIVIDESTIKNTHDAGPVCGCREKYQMVQDYVAFVPGGINPYKRRKIPDEKCFQITWNNIRIGSQDLIFEKPFANRPGTIRPNTNESSGETKMEDLMFLRPPRCEEA